ncbi:MAG: hypothetical protein Q7I99_04290 [Acholeplasmataceae bacterium]|nr:hypothetical protein [Acholeplasmataceae bacterium]
MKPKDRLLVFLSSYFWAILGLFLTGSFLFFIIPVYAFLYLLFGGEKRA